MNATEIAENLENKISFSYIDLNKFLNCSLMPVDPEGRYERAYAGPSIPFNGNKPFEDLPEQGILRADIEGEDKLRLTFDTGKGVRFAMIMDNGSGTMYLMEEYDKNRDLWRTIDETKRTNYTNSGIKELFLTQKEALIATFETCRILMKYAEKARK